MRNEKHVWRARSIALAGCLALLSVSTADVRAEEWAPSKVVEIVVGSAAGGGNDKSGRAIQKVLTQEQIAESVVLNKVGGGGGIAYGYVSQKGDPHFIGIAQGGLMSNHISGRSELDPLTDVTPLSYMGNEAVAIAVRTDSPYKNISELLAQLEKDPASLSISVGSDRGGTNHSGIALLAKAKGIDAKQLKIVIFGGGAESVTNLLGGHIDAMSQLQNNAIPHHQAGTMRILCLTSAERAASVPDVPTCKEEGYDVIANNWTVVLGPKDMTPEQIAGWEKILKRVSESQVWIDLMASSSASNEYKNSAETKEFFAADYQRAKELMTELGMAK
ncbi:tripartite tricarboxylate transporter substrate binding protein [Pseudaminobacter arsenicus]|uniref:Tripartite tricarboxylate transporter substrate binding protein n=1 Tax=Borborobacter arsenicus TaxID=1851146 RepID=A0A432V2R0_9HYPH|nr:tripartite tricarboxylate transporter substrate binding protein [Pseudaminobacter arsenicus]RUM96494.1 tripartite tricarboxylate transporter substrate binding protein [Pseudaminobacter arsenicus]